MNAFGALKTGCPCKDLILRPAKGASGFYRAAPPRVILRRGDPPIDLDA